MRTRLRRLALAGGILALLATATPPAHGLTTIRATFVATVTFETGLQYPVVTGLPIEGPTTHCLPLNGAIALPNCHNRFNTPIRFTLTSVACTDVSLNIDKGPLPPLHVGGCLLVLTGTVSGHCGLSGGQASGFYISSLGQSFAVSVHFNSVGPKVVFSGHWQKQLTHPGEPQQHGLVVGFVDAILPTAALTPGQSCTNGTAQDFTLVGDSSLVTDPLL